MGLITVAVTVYTNEFLNHYSVFLSQLSQTCQDIKMTHVHDKYTCMENQDHFFSLQVHVGNRNIDLLI